MKQAIEIHAHVQQEDTRPKEQQEKEGPLPVSIIPITFQLQDIQSIGNPYKDACSILAKINGETVTYRCEQPTYKEIRDLWMEFLGHYWATP